MAPNKVSTKKEEQWLRVVSFKTELLTEAIIHKGYRESLPILLPQLPLFRNRMILDNDIYIDLNETNEIQEYFIQNIIERTEEAFSSIEKQSRKLLATARKVNNGKVDLIKRLSEFFLEYQKTIGAIGVPTIIDLTLEKHLKNELNQAKINVNEEFRKLTIPEQPIGTFKAEEELLQIAFDIDEGKSLNSKEIQDRIKEHAQKYGWIHSTLFLGKLYTKDDVIEDLRKLKGKSKQQRIELKERQKNQKHEAESIIKSLPINARKLAVLLQKAVYFRTARLEWMNEACYLARPLLEEAAKILQLTYNDVIYFLSEELLEALKTKKLFVSPSIEIRKEGYGYISDNSHEYFLIVAEELKNEKAKFAQQSDQNLVKGIVACKSFVKGKVVIVRDRSELNKVRSGEVLITPLTTPDFIPAMKKATAIVTDLGGMTSHAAIVSRELNKPCIVGTKIATKVFKDGDLIEVDANNGTVKLHSRKEIEQIKSPETEWYHLGKWVEPALAAELWLNWGRYAKQFFREKLDGDILYINGDFFLSQHDVNVMKKESYDAAKNLDKDFFDKLKETIIFVSDKITNASRTISSPLKFLKSYQELTGVWMTLNIISLGVEKYVNEINDEAFTIANGNTAEKPWTLKQIDEMRKIKKDLDKIPENIDKLPKELQKRIINHVSAYEWKGSHHFSIHKFTVEEFLKQMKDDKEDKQIKQNKGSVSSYSIKLLDLMGFIRFRCAEASGISSYYLSKHLTMLAESHGLSYGDIVEHTIEEIEGGRINKSIAEKRKKDTGFLFNKKVYELTEEEIKSYACKLLQNGGSAADEIKGVIACKGKAIGFVKFVRSKKEMEGFEKGMILVAYETTPDVIFAMKKAGAIVTDFGGLTSHAAIVSREFNIPCIVGTQTATKILKDGDKVEVDADKGIVKKLK